MYGLTEEGRLIQYDGSGTGSYYGNAGGRWHAEARRRKEIQQRHADAIEREEAIESAEERARFIETWGVEEWEKERSQDDR